MNTPEDYTIEAVDPRNAPDGVYAASSVFGNRMRAERRPDDPPVPLEETVASMRHIPPFVDVRAWLARDRSGEMVGSANAVFLRTDENRHVAQFSVEVLPEHRRRGLGRCLLEFATAATETEGRRLMLTSTTSRVPAGEAFMERLSAERGLEMRVSQLDLARLDRDLLRRWVERAPERAGAYELGLWDGPVPEDQIEAAARLVEVMNTAPRENLEMEDFHFTPEQLRQMERHMIATGTRRWMLYARDAASGDLAGFTELSWHPARPAILDQGGTGVFPAHRERGLGRWLKAAMLSFVLEGLPEARFVRTGNAESNAAMLAINLALGFAPYASDVNWQVETARVRAYLGGAG